MHIATFPVGAGHAEADRVRHEPSGGRPYATPPFESLAKMLEAYDEGVRRRAHARGHDRRRVDGAVDAEERREDRVQHAARGRVSSVHHEPRHPSSRSAVRVSATVRCSAAEHLRPYRRHAEPSVSEHLHGFSTQRRGISERSLRLCVEFCDGRRGSAFFCEQARSTNPTLAGRSPRRRMKYGNHSLPNGT